MDLRRLRAGEWIAAVSGAALLASLFLPWYTVADVAAGTGWASYAPLGAATVTGWESLGLLDVVLALIALFAIALLVVTTTQSVAAVPIAMDALVTLAGILATLLVLIRVIWLPDDADGREWALWLALAGSLGIVVGGAFAMRDERLSPPGRHTDASGRPTAGPPEIEALPAPHPEGSG
jgi:hypothetical protein